VNELRMDLHSALVEFKGFHGCEPDNCLCHILEFESHGSDLGDESEQDDEIATMETGMKVFPSDDDGSDNGSDDMLEAEMGGNYTSVYERADDMIDKFQLLCQERTRSAVIEFLQENLEWIT